jgi:dTDP-4-amino-4,6-dideoxygalactose transaminase
MADVAVGSRERRLVSEVLDSGRLAQGPMVERFEAAIADVTGVEHVVAVHSGTAALVVALQALDIGPGDEVVIPAMTFGATLNAVIATGATARIADIGPDFTIDPGSVVRLLTGRTRAVLPVHLYGLPADLGALEGMLPRDTLMVEDAAQAIGAAIDGRPVGNATAGCFSFYATKNVMAGEGGAITTHDRALAGRASMIRNQGMSGRYEYAVPGLNWRMSDLHAAIGVGQMERLAELTRRRQENAAALDRMLGGIGWLRLPLRPPGRTHVFHQYTVVVADHAPVPRDELAKRLDDHGVATAIVYPRAVHDYDCFRSHPGIASDPTPLADAMARRLLSLPVHPGVDEDDITYIGDLMRSIAERSTHR